MYLIRSRFEDVKSYSAELESVLTALLQIREVIYICDWLCETLHVLYFVHLHKNSCKILIIQPIFDVYHQNKVKEFLY